MKFCPKCKVKIENNLEICPLCQRPVQPLDDVFVTEYPSHPSRRRLVTLMKVIGFLAVLLITGTVLLSAFSNFQWVWSLVVIAAVVYLGVSIVLVVKSSKNIGLLVMIQALSLSVLTFLIDHAFGYYRWSINYVIPFLAIAGTLLITLILLFRPMALRDFFIYLLVIALLGGFSGIMLLCRWVTVAWPSVAAALYCVATLAGLFLFADRRARHEMKKRFHL